ncbi:hypothetical protein FOCC_FOCC013010 [Frankliniella occidentalis]|nr:hypothetical protein FOCC_FOCC013010 [Frankliniella occidentalis]
MAELMEEHSQSPLMEENKEMDDPMEGGVEEEDYDEYDEFHKARGLAGRGGMGGPEYADYPDFGPRGPPMGRPPGPYGMNGPHGPHGPHPRFRGRGGFGPRGPPPGFRGPPPPHFGGPRGPRFRGGPPPNWDPNWGPPGMGPPPHMMGPPPPGMGGVSSMDLLSGEVWVETKAGDGKVYYYNARTRDTTWTKPDGPDVKILTQEQVESLAQAAGVQPGANPVTTTAAQAAVAQANSSNALKAEDGTQAPGTGAMPNTMQPPPGMMQGPPPGMPPFGGPPPQFGGPPPFGMPPPGYQQGYPPYNAPPGGAPGAWNMPPQGMPPGVGPMQGLPPTAMPPPTAAAGHGATISSPAVPNPAIAAAAAPQPANCEESAGLQIDPEIMARASEWSEHRAPDGRSYYYNAKLGQSVWEKPQPLRDLENAKLAAAQGIASMPVLNTPVMASVVPNMVNNEGESSDDEEEDDTVPAGTQPVHIETGSINTPIVNGSASAIRPENESEDEEEKEKRKQADEEDLKKKREEEEKAKEIQRQQDKSRPVSSTPVPGTPWCVVWTGDGRVFFYNPSSRTSVWERPEDLVGRTDVDKMVGNPPDSLLNSQTNQGTGSNGVNTSENSASLALKRENKSDDEQPVPPKKIKKEELPIKEVKEETKPPEKKQIEVGKEAAMEAEVRAARERAIVPLDTRIKSFREMLAEKEVSAFSTWEKELHKIVFDPRYLLLTSKERKQVFEKYVKERAEEERREKRNKMKEKRDDFRRLLEEANLHGKSSFSDFAQKYGKDERFKNIDKMRERESLFNEYLLDVRKREKEEKLQRREQVSTLYINILGKLKGLWCCWSMVSFMCKPLPTI